MGSVRSGRGTTLALAANFGAVRCKRNFWLNWGTRSIRVRFPAADLLDTLQPIMADNLQRRESLQGDEILLGDAAVLTRLDKAIGWARQFSIFPYPFATACCAMEYISLASTPYDIDRFCALLPRFTPRP